MSSKQDKKLKQMFRRNIRGQLDQMTKEYFSDEAPIFKIKPKWCPQWLWSKLIALLMDESFLLQYETRQAKIKEKKLSESYSDEK